MKTPPTALTKYLQSLMFFFLLTMSLLKFWRVPLISRDCHSNPWPLDGRCVKLTGYWQGSCLVKVFFDISYWKISQPLSKVSKPNICNGVDRWGTKEGLMQKAKVAARRITLMSQQQLVVSHVTVWEKSFFCVVWREKPGSATFSTVCNVCLCEKWVFGCFL